MYCFNCIEEAAYSRERELALAQHQIDVARDMGSTIGRIAYQGGALTGIAVGAASSALTRGVVQAGAGVISGARMAWQGPVPNVQPQPPLSPHPARPQTLPVLDVSGGGSNDEMARLREEMNSMRRRNQDLERQLMAAHEVAAEACSERGRSSVGGYQTPTMTPQRTAPMPAPVNAAVSLEPPAPPGLQQQQQQQPMAENPVSPTSLDRTWNMVSTGDSVQVPPTVVDQQA